MASSRPGSKTHIRNTNFGAGAADPGLLHLKLVLHRSDFMKWRVLGVIAGVLTIVAQFLPWKARRFVLYKVKRTMYLVFG